MMTPGQRSKVRLRHKAGAAVTRGRGNKQHVKALIVPHHQSLQIQSDRSKPEGRAVRQETDRETEDRQTGELEPFCAHVSVCDVYLGHSRWRRTVVCGEIYQ